MIARLALVAALSAATAVAAETEDRLQRHVRALTEIQPPRNFAHPESLDAAAAYVRHGLAEAGWRGQEQVYRVDGQEYRNIRAFRGDPRAPRVVVGAHYDVHGDTPGADDNASGVAVLIELARALRDHQPDLGLELVAYTLEEQPAFARGVMGSARHARALAEEGVAVAGMLSLEMLGYYSDAPGSQTFPVAGLDWFYPDTGDFIGLIGRLRDWRLLRRVATPMREVGGVATHYLASPLRFPGLAYSDHRNYWARDWLAIMVTDTAFYRNPHYHRTTDTAGTLDYARMAMLVPQLAAAVRALTTKHSQKGEP